MVASEEPQLGQKQRCVPGVDSYARIWPVKRTADVGNRTQAATGAPVARWHTRQWQ